MGFQITPRRDGHKQAALARRLLNAVSIPERVQYTLLRWEQDWSEGAVITRTAGRTILVGGIEIQKNEQIVLVASKWSGMWYCQNTAGEWSTVDPMTIRLCENRIKLAA
jgi:hypothetical protein